MIHIKIIQHQPFTGAVSRQVVNKRGRGRALQSLIIYYRTHMRKLSCSWKFLIIVLTLFLGRKHLESAKTQGAWMFFLCIAIPLPPAQSISIGITLLQLSSATIDYDTYQWFNLCIKLWRNRIWPFCLGAWSKDIYIGSVHSFPYAQSLIKINTIIHELYNLAASASRFTEV